MAEPLKDHFDAAVVRRIGAMLRSAHAPRSTGFGMSVFLYLPHVIFVAENGLDHFAQRTTRRHHPGRHRIEALVNGRAVRVGHVDVVGS